MSEQPKWTPGPWGTDAELHDQRVLDARGNLVAECCIISIHPEVSPERCSANGRLIAAAPELYSQLQAARDIFMECAEDAAGTPSETYFKDMAHDCDCTLAKARGTSPE